MWRNARALARFQGIDMTRVEPELGHAVAQVNAGAGQHGALGEIGGCHDHCVPLCINYHQLRCVLPDGKVGQSSDVKWNLCWINL